MVDFLRSILVIVKYRWLGDIRVFEPHSTNPLYSTPLNKVAIEPDLVFFVFSCSRFCVVFLCYQCEGSVIPGYGTDVQHVIYGVNVLMYLVILQ